MKIIDANKIKLKKYVADIVIIGAGLSGTYLTKEIQNKNLKIIVIDRGDIKKKQH